MQLLLLLFPVALTEQPPLVGTPSPFVSESELLAGILSCFASITKQLDLPKWSWLGLSNTMATEYVFFKVWICCVRQVFLIIKQECQTCLLAVPEDILSVFYPKVSCSLQRGCLMLAQDQTSFGSRGG